MNTITNIVITFPSFDKYGLIANITTFNNENGIVFHKSFETVSEFKEILNKLTLGEDVEVQFTIKKTDMAKDPYIIQFMDDILIEINTKN